MNEQKQPMNTDETPSVVDARDTSLDSANAERDSREPGLEPRDSDTEVYNAVREGHENGYHESGILDTNSTGSLIPIETAESHREQWSEIQARFVDDPKDAVEQADELVSEVIQLLTSQFAGQRKGLESQWQQGGEASSEDLRQAFLQYRTFFERLLAA